LSVTKRGKAWDLRNSLWILWTFTGFGFIAFFWIGSRAKHKAWTLLGCLYLVLLFTGFFLSTENLATVGVPLMMITWVASIAHAFIIRKSYLLRRELFLEGAEQRNAETVRKNEELRRKIRGETTNQAEDSFIPIVEKKESLQQMDKIPEEQPATEPLDLNNCTESELALLPGIGAVRAKKIVALRSEKGGFSSFDDFVNSLKIEPHFAVQINTMVVVSEVEQIRQESTAQDRLVDI
jgi:DNA uptake protein ComE-like DNA-binding protein